jgi:tetratricopeptide (TPR) repeat protein
MKQIFWLKYLSLVLLFTPLLSVNNTQVFAAKTTYIAQSKSSYDQNMQQGYAATSQRNYRRALQFFQQALQSRPGDSYATAAINNVQNYIRRGENVITFNVGQPGRRLLGATRGGCQNVQRAIPLTPSDLEAQTTTSKYPTFFFYIPQISGVMLEFTLRDDTSVDPLYKQTFKPTGQAGIVSITIPNKSNIPPLETGKEYTWGLSIVCDARARDKDLFIKGQIKRFEADQNLTLQLQKASPRERAILYATAGFWEDTIKIMAELRRQRPNDSEIKTDWESILKSVELVKPEKPGKEKEAKELEQKIIKAPLLLCCTP